MRIELHRQIDAFRERAMPLLMEDECGNCVLIGIIERLSQGKPATRSGLPCEPMLLTLEREGAIVAAALQTPPHALLFSAMDESSADRLTQHLYAQHWQGSEFSGSIPTVHRLANRWRALTGRDYALHLALRLFRTSAVVDPAPAPGRFRVAAAADLPLMSQWIDAFGREIHEPFPDPSSAAKTAIDEGRLHLWEDDGEPRAICAWQGPTPSSVRIGLVYTPLVYRGRGYASNAVAELTRRLLASGRTYCTLFTDKSNPTSNSIYRKIGYEPVADFEHVRFEGTSTPAR